MNLNHLHYFWSVAHEGNLTRAAKKLNVSQSALSVQIRKLEDRLGHLLFERRGKQLLLTEAGHIALDHADAIFAAGSELVATLKESEALSRRVIRLGALSTLSRNFQINFLRPLFSRDDVEIALRSGSAEGLLHDLENHRLDVVLVNQLPVSGDAKHWVTNPVAEQRVSLVGTSDRLRNSGGLQDLIAKHPLIVPSLASSVRSRFNALIESINAEPKIVAEVDDMAMMRLLAREDVGLAVVPPIVVKDELESGRLIEADVLPGLTETFYAVTLKRRFPNTLLPELLAAAALPET